jgi:hypothetical protein
LHSRVINDLAAKENKIAARKINSLQVKCKTKNGPRGHEMIITERDCRALVDAVAGCK